MNNWQMKLKTAYALGLSSIAQVLIYRLKKKIGYWKIETSTYPELEGVFFKKTDTPIQNLPAITAWHQSALYFGWYTQSLTPSPPAWHSNPFMQTQTPAILPWWAIQDFNPTQGDIKWVWEASRFNWVLAFAQRIKTGDVQMIDKLNQWLSDWHKNNPPYYGANWKCGQEAAIRIMHLAMASIILGTAKQTEPALLGLIQIHLQRILLTLQYAMAQNNNHGISEAAGLFIGGTWLSYSGIKTGKTYAKKGRRWIENRVKHLIMPDGSFSQYSLNYHRFILDIFSMTEIWRAHFNLKPFSNLMQQRMAAAIEWLAAMVCRKTGDVPNVGANDGSRLLPLSNTDERDFRPSLQLASVLFLKKRKIAQNGEWNTPLAWLNIPVPQDVSHATKSQIFHDGGFAVLKKHKAMLLFRYPRFRFRPSHADALHLDLWYDGNNLLRDAGSYSYHTDATWLTYFSGTAAHNTIQFDDTDQMPRISRFLFGSWLKTCWLEAFKETRECVTFGAAYQNTKKFYHQRHVSLQKNKLIVQDKMMGFQKKAVLRWRLMDDDWAIQGHMIHNGQHQLSIESDVPIIRFDLVEGWESRYYGKKTRIPVLEIEVQKPGMITSHYQWLL